MHFLNSIPVPVYLLWLHYWWSKSSTYHLVDVLFGRFASVSMSPEAAERGYIVHMPTSGSGSAPALLPVSIPMRLLFPMVQNTWLHMLF